MGRLDLHVCYHLSVFGNVKVFVGYAVAVFVFNPNV